MPSGRAPFSSLPTDRPFARSDARPEVARTGAAGMSDRSTGRWNAASGDLLIALGIAGAAFERGSPPLTAPIEEVVAFWSTYQRALLAQSLTFVLGAGAYRPARSVHDGRRDAA